MDLFQAGISAGVGLVALLVAALLRTVGRAALPRLTIALIIGGFVALLGTPIGAKMRAAVVGTDHWLGSFVGQYLGVAVFGLLGIVCVVTLAFDVHHKRIINRTLICAAGAPLLGATIPGMVGEMVMWACRAVATCVGLPLSWALGMA